MSAIIDDNKEKLHERSRFSALQKFIFPPERRFDTRGYGMTLRQRFPDLPPASIGELNTSSTRRFVLLFTAMLVGLAAGTAAATLKLCTDTLGRWLTSGFDPATRNWWLIILPVAGILLACIYQRYVMHRQLSHGVERINYDFARHRCYMPISLTYSPMVAATVTLGFGGSAGSEGPIAFAGASIGSNIAALLRLSPQMVRVMTAIGAGAGIAGIFKAPLGGVLFTVEVLCVEMTIFSVAALFVACVTSAVTAYILSGCTPDIAFHHEAAVSLDCFPMILLFGVVCGIYSTYYSSIMTFVRGYLERMRNMWVRAVAAGLTIGGLSFLFPALYGEGYGAVAKLLGAQYDVICAGGIAPAAASNPAMLILIAVALMLGKPFAASSTNSGGGAAGDFAPTIMVGSVTGFVFAGACDYFLGMNLQIPDFIFMGIAGILAGAIRAPLMSMFLITEMATLGYGQFMPVAIVSAVSYFTVCTLQWMRFRLCGSGAGRLSRPPRST